MPKQQRFKTNYPGVYYIIGTKAGTSKPERIYYISFRKAGKKIEEKAGRQYQDDMTPARANKKRAQKIDGIIPTNKEGREAKEAEKKAKADKWTIDKLWTEYSAGRKPGKSLVTDSSRYNLYIQPAFANKEPKEILALEIDRMRISLLKKKSPQTVKHVLNLLTWIINFGVNTGLCEGLSFRIKKPVVNNLVTEDLNSDQLSKLLKAIDADSHPQAGTMMLLALYSGMRRGEMFKLKWKHVDFERGFITLKDPKPGLDQVIPLNDAARGLLENHPRIASPYVFPGRGGRKRTNINKAVREIKNSAGLPKNFRALHGLRHVFASSLASSGKVDLYTLQKLLTHKSPQMTARYAHLRDDALKAASNVASEIFEPKKEDKSNVIELNQK